MLFDSHAHLTSSSLFEQVDAIVLRSLEAGVSSILNICTDVSSLEKGLALSKRYSWIFQAAATTPHDVEKEGEQAFDSIAKAARHGSLRAIGETGLDYYYEHSPKNIQQHFLRRYFQLALECHLPVVLHCREAFADLFSIADTEYRTNNHYGPAILHCFTGTIEEAEEVIKRGWFLSLSGIVTFKKSLTLQEVAKRVPLDHLLIETDSPYLAPQMRRGQQNEPSFLVDIAQFLADSRKISFEELVQATSANARKALFLEN